MRKIYKNVTCSYYMTVSVYVSLSLSFSRWLFSLHMCVYSQHRRIMHFAQHFEKREHCRRHPARLPNLPACVKSLQRGLAVMEKNSNP